MMVNRKIPTLQSGNETDLAVRRKVAFNIWWYQGSFIWTHYAV